MVKIHLFGPPGVEKNGVKLHIPRRKTLALLAYLAAGEQPRSREVLATLLYPDQDHAGSRNNLRRDLSELKFSLGEAWLLYRGDQISLVESTGLWVDVREFHHLLEKTRNHQKSEGHDHEGLCVDCQSDLECAVDLYQADFMSGFTIPGSREFDEWQFYQAEDLRQEYIEALQTLTRWHASLGEYETAIPYARRWLAIDPLHEPAQRQLMWLYAWSGQPAAALRQYQEVTRLLMSELGVEPDAETTQLYEDIRTRKIPGPSVEELPQVGTVSSRPAAARTPHNLPRLENPIIGREIELRQVVKCLKEEDHCRLLTVAGPGGIGKTSLAVEAANLLASDPSCPFCEGVYFVPLFQISQEDSVIPAIAQVLKIPLVPDPKEHTQQLFNYLQPKRVLLLLDNFEHLISPGSTQLLTDLLAYASDVKLLVTSRTYLNVHLEHILNIGGLQTPDAIADLQNQLVESVVVGFSALQLFETVARKLLPEFSIHRDNLAPIVRICQMVEGMPLGIELAAAWLEMLTPDKIAAEIASNMDFLEVQWPDLPERQHSLRAVFDSSWKLLEENERNTLLVLSAFQGGFSRQAAQQVSKASLQLLMALRNKSWLQVQSGGRYQIHELLRQYLSEQLRTDPTTTQYVKSQFAGYYASYLEHQSTVIKGPEQKSAIDEISVEFGNIRLAWSWLVELGQIEIVIRQMLFPLFRYAEARWKSFELMPLIEQALQGIEQNEEFSSQPQQEAILLTALGSFDKAFNAERLGGFLYFMRKEVITKAWSLAGNPQTLLTMGFWGSLLACLYSRCTENQQGENVLREILPIIRLQNDRWELANALLAMASLFGWAMDERGRWGSLTQETETMLNEALTLFESLRDKSSSAISRSCLGNLFFYQKKYGEAVAQWQLAYKILNENDEVYYVAGIAESLANGFQQAGDFEASYQISESVSQTLIDRGYKTGAGNLMSWISINALRHSNLEYALQARLRSLQYYEGTAAENSKAWGIWEMGEIKRVAGDLNEAFEWYEKARTLFEDLDDASFPVFYRRSLGDLALATSNYHKAKAEFLESIRLAQVLKHNWAWCYGLMGLGKSQIALGEFEAARENLSHAIDIAIARDEPGMILNCVAAFAMYFASLGDIERARALSTFALEHHFTWNEARVEMNSLRQSLVEVEPEQRAAAEKVWRNLDLGQAIELIKSA